MISAQHLRKAKSEKGKQEGDEERDEEGDGNSETTRWAQRRRNANL